MQFGSVFGITCAESSADMPLREFLSSTWDHIQDNLFPWLQLALHDIPRESSLPIRRC